MQKYDVIVIGAGSAGLGNTGVGYTIGLKTLLIEKDERNFGGDCTNYGCVPSKALIHVAKLFHAAKQAAPFGLESSGKADMQKILDYIHSKQDFIRDGEDADALRKKGADVVIGTAQFEDKNTVVVGDQKFTAKVILLCTGSSPRKLNIPGMEKVKIYTNESLFFDCKTLPEHFVIIGGGAIGCEMAQAFQRLGSKVTIVDRGHRILSKERENISAVLEQRFLEEGITISYNSEVKAFEGGKCIIKTKIGEETIPCDAVLMAVGRVVNTKNMGLEKAGIALTERGKIKVDEYLRSTNPNVYVVGDAAGKYMFSHGAEKMVRQLWRNLLIPLFKKKNTTKNLSWVTFTDPEVATFGWSEEKLAKENVDYYRQDQNFEHDDRAIVDEYQYGQMSIWTTNGSNIGGRTILSGTMIAPKAGDLIQELQLASENKIPIKKITERVYPYPVASRINQKTLRGLMEKTFTETKKKLARISFRLFN
ncbi:MAG: NAD(P)/FAD-dependent oxidoreductase [Saprospiraceae bacterium]